MPWLTKELSDVSFHSLNNEPHTLSPFFAVPFDGVFAGVSTILPTSEKGYSSFWLIEIRARRARLCRVNHLFAQPQLAENDGL